MDIIDRTTQPSLHWPGLRAIFGQYDAASEVYTQFYDVKTSMKSHEEDVEVYGFGLAQVQPELAPVVFDKTGEGVKITYRHVAYGLAFAVSREEMADNLYAQVGSKRIRSLNYSLRQTREIVAHTTLDLGFDAVLGVRPDGVPLYSAAHPTPAGNQSNLVATAADISELSLEQIAVQMSNMRDQRGLKLNTKPKRLIISNEQSFEAQRILGSVLQANTANNNINVLKARNIIPEVLSTPYLSDKDAFFVQSDLPEGFCFFNRTAGIEIDEDSSFSNGAKMVKAYMRFSAGVTDWRAAGIGNPGA